MTRHFVVDGLDCRQGNLRLEGRAVLLPKLLHYRSCFRAVYRSRTRAEPPVSFPGSISIPNLPQTASSSRPIDCDPDLRPPGGLGRLALRLFNWTRFNTK